MENETKPVLEIGQTVKARDCQRDLAELGDIYYCEVVSIIEPDIYSVRVSMSLPVGKNLTYNGKIAYQFGGWVMILL
jgi:hypothetical protein